MKNLVLTLMVLTISVCLVIQENTLANFFYILIMIPSMMNHATKNENDNQFSMVAAIVWAILLIVALGMLIFV